MKSKELNAQEEFKKGVDAYHNYNYTEAVSWYKKAAEQGYAYTIAALKRLEEESLDED